AEAVDRNVQSAREAPGHSFEQLSQTLLVTRQSSDRGAAQYNRVSVCARIQPRRRALAVDIDLAGERRHTERDLDLIGAGVPDYHMILIDGDARRLDRQTVAPRVDAVEDKTSFAVGDRGAQLFRVAAQYHPSGLDRRALLIHHLPAKTMDGLRHHRIQAQ